MASEDYRNPSQVEMNRIVSVDNVQTKNQALLAGNLLKVMDAVACLSAEKHAKLACVTLMMDDLQVNTIPSHGQVLNVKAKLTRAFGSSMEVVVEVAVEDFRQSKKTNICQAYFTFVAIAKSGKAKLTHLDPVTMEERLQYALAIERKRIRLVARNAALAKSKQQSTKPKGDTRLTNVYIKADHRSMSETSVESIELVLPSDANHHQSTFGGQIMAWLVSTCTIAASRLCHTAPSILAVNGVQFLASSSVGDRLVFKAMVNKVFDDNSMEVGCRVEANSIEGDPKHINSAYLTFVNFDDQGQRKPLPEVVATTVEQAQRHTNAESRRQAQIDKTKILETVGPALSVPWSNENSNILAYHNVSGFRKLYHLENWVEVSKEGSSVLSTCTQDQLQCIKVETQIPISAHYLFTALSSHARPKWDPVVSKSEVIKKIDEDDNIVHFIMATAETSSEKPNDFLMLESSRPPSSKQDNYVIAYRSITLKSSPPLAEYNRKENLSSGFLIQESDEDPAKSTLIYINQMTDQVSSYVTSDLAGTTKNYAKRIGELQKYLKTISTS